ncbi:MFS general substrate transporter [Guyanagaster necrorhizus]|uniref:MFS general substrate transporter n=1 Tax=Guyanagaster necrorhizus TaxID=856835 RepID=A0A9P7VJI1_9AGAR|nr:MFS general substrate transporter [Guyanagaster necrorhizus MCA 3950]KAG7441627.1 MFS general substrate transporter [Guyanagaster necrorhizus MCA 3950]
MSLSEVDESGPSSSLTILPSVDATYQHLGNARTKELGWDGLNDPSNPRNWSNRRRWTVTLVVSLFTFISPVASSISSPALPIISDALDIPHDSILQNMSLSIFVLAYALGPLIWGPMSELCGRLVVLQVSNIWFLVFNTICSIAKTPTQMLIFRFLAGFGGAAPQSVGGGVVGDLWSPEERGMAMSLYSLAPLVGPSTGPLVGGWIASRVRWEWVFWSVSISDAILQIAGFIFLEETYVPELQKRKARALRKSTGNVMIRSRFEQPGRHCASVMTQGMIKPLKFLATEPIVQVFALYMAVLYGVLYLSLSSFVKVYTDQYHENTGISGLHYLAIALGSTVGGQVGARVLNRIYVRLKVKNGGIGTPEMRLPLLMVSATTLPIGLLIYGWTANARIFWLAPGPLIDIGVFIYSIGIGGNWTCIQTYLVDNYALHAASAIAGVSSFRAFAGFGFPLFADKMYERVGDGWGNSILALICLVIGCPAPFIFYRYGPQLRTRSKATSVEQ